MAPACAGGLRHLALIVVQPDAVVAAEGRADYGTYELFVPENIDERIETELYDALREARGRGEDSCAQPGSRRRSKR